MRVVVVGGGVLGTMHSWFALRRGHQVVQIEREGAARGASVRNFGLIWVSGRAEGHELATALRSRQLWEELAGEVPAVGFRPAGSLTVARTDAELAVAADAMTLPSADVRDFELLDPAGLRRVNPALGGELMGGLWCRRDAAVEPRGAQSAIRERMLAKPGYQWLPGREVRQVEPQLVLDDHGEAHRGDLVIVCTGAWFGGLIRELAPDLPLRRVRLQMMQTEPLDQALTTAVADGDSFRYYPAFRTETLDADQPQTPVAAEHHMQLLMVQRNDGGLTIGDTHAYDEPFDFDVDEDPYRHLVSVAEALLGRPVPAVSRRWAGVYAQTLDRSLIVHRSQVRPGVWLVTGPGGRGMTCSPAIAEATLEEAGF
jgi:FAD dependent oxidoreductase TIGR03364